MQGAPNSIICGTPEVPAPKIYRELILICTFSATMLSFKKKGANIVMRNILAILLVLCLSACASESKDIASSYVSPLQYKDLDCDQISQEMARISSRTAELSGIVDSNATKDTVSTAVAIVVFWPAAFLVKGDGQKAAEYARLKGEFEALEKVSIEKKCGITIKKQKATS